MDAMQPDPDPPENDISTGGAPIYVELVDEPIDTLFVWQRLQEIQCGAHNIFLGTTRLKTHGKETRYLVYDAYRPMALQQLRIAAGLALQRWELHRVVMIHRLGRVDLGQASIAIGVCAPHRQGVFDATSWLLEQVKQQVPIWKQENWADGLTQWVHP